MQGIPTYLKLARNWLQVQWLNTLDPEGCISARAFHDYLLSINAPVLETVKYCQDAEWFDHRPWYDSRIDDYITGEYCLMRPVMGDDWPQALQPQAVAGAVGELRDAAGGGDGMTWQDAQAELEALQLKGEPFTSRRKMGQRIGCSPFLIQKAINNGPVELQEWASKQRAASRLNAAPEVAAMAFEDAPQAREPDPADIAEDGDVDAAMAYLLDQAGPDERARINAMTPAERRRLAETVYRDPEREEQALRHRRAAKTRRN